MKKAMLLLLSTAVMVGCSGTDHAVPQAEKDRLAQIDWLIGEWAMVEEGRELAEHWERANDISFRGFGMTVRDGDTTVTEELEIRATDSGLYYIADVPQNAEPVWFGLTVGSDSVAVFENPEYQLPNKITYSREGAEIIRVRVDGFRGEEPTGFEWLLARAGSSTDSPADSLSDTISSH